MNVKMTVVFEDDFKLCSCWTAVKEIIGVVTVNLHATMCFVRWTAVSEVTYLVFTCSVI